MYRLHYFDTVVVTDCYSAPNRGAEYCNELVSQSVCVCVFRSVIISLRNYQSIFTKFFVHVTYGRVSILLWHHSDTLCISGCIFAHKLRLLDVATMLMQ